MADTENKTEKATPKRRRDARSKGQVARSQEVNNALILLASLLLLYFAGSGMIRRLAAFMELSLGHIDIGELTTSGITPILSNVMVQCILVVLPVMVGLFILSAASSYLQVGFVLSPNVLVPDLNKINPVNGMKKLFSLRSSVSLAVSLAKITIVAIVAYLTIKGKLGGFLHLIGAGVPQMCKFLTSSTFEVGLKIALLLIVIGILDYAYQRWQYEKDLRMTKQEVKEEARLSEGDPLIKGRVRQVQREMARRRMMKDVPTADVVISNPTHYAVALRYNSDSTDSAPVVVAKGMNLLARRIIEIAKANGVPVIEDRPLARMLYKVVDIGQEIPPILYRAVAKILAQIYRRTTGKMPVPPRLRQSTL